VGQEFQQYLQLQVVCQEPQVVPQEQGVVLLEALVVVHTNLVLTGEKVQVVDQVHRVKGTMVGIYMVEGNMFLEVEVLVEQVQAQVVQVE
jgi:hypothetical protein